MLKRQQPVQKVSIPFKRESGSKQRGNDRILEGRSVVSIPFKRESGSKLRRNQNGKNKETGFNSLQTGKRFQTVYMGYMQHIRNCFNSLQTGKRFQTGDQTSRVITQKFQFPSNGKAVPNVWSSKGYVKQKEVSIPFKRESGSKRTPRSGCGVLFGFNSLQTGKRFQTKEGSAL